MVLVGLLRIMWSTVVSPGAMALRHATTRFAAARAVSSFETRRITT